MDGYPFACPIQVRWRDVDALGHVNNATIVTYLETARTELWRERFGGGTAIPFVVARVEVDYRRQLGLDDRVRVVPGGTTVRRGAHLGENVILMPPAYVNVGAWVGPDTMIDSHALVGSCAQVGRGVHVSAAAQIGGVLEPPGARPVILEDQVLVGGNCGIYEGTLVRRRAVLGSGVILTASTPVYDVPNRRVLRSESGRGIEIPEGAVVVPGVRRITGEFADAHGLGLYTPVIVKYRDESTDARTALESALR